MPRNYKRIDPRTLEVVEIISTENKQTYTYDFILNRIQELELELAQLKELKIEADKLNLIR